MLIPRLIPYSLQSIFKYTSIYYSRNELLTDSTDPIRKINTRVMYNTWHGIKDNSVLEIYLL